MTRAATGCPQATRCGAHSRSLAKTSSTATATPAPWNFIWHDNEAVGLIDWDYFHPAPRLDDVAYALRWFVPFRSDELAKEWHHFPEAPDRRHRIQLFLNACGDLSDFDVVDAVTSRIQATIDHCRALADTGQEPQRT
jgi:hypothetical protein